MAGGWQEKAAEFYDKQLEEAKAITSAGGAAAGRGGAVSSLRGRPRSALAARPSVGSFSVGGGGVWRCQWCGSESMIGKGVGPDGKISLCWPCTSDFRAGRSRPALTPPIESRCTCARCGVKFSGHVELAEHHKYCDGSPWACKWCGCGADEAGGKGPGPDETQRVQRAALCKLCSCRWLAGHKKPKLEGVEAKRLSAPPTAIDRRRRMPSPTTIPRVTWQADLGGVGRKGAITSISLIEADTNPRTGIKRIHSSESQLGVRQAMTLHAGGKPDPDAGRRPPPPTPLAPPPTRQQRVASLVPGSEELSMRASRSAPLISDRGQPFASSTSRPGSAAEGKR